jgi:SAM-dependent methyltransferase
LNSASQPVLVDFERSILAASDFTHSEAKRRSLDQSLRKVAQRVIVGRYVNQTARENAKRFIAELPARRRILIIGGAVKGSGAEELYEDPSLSVISFDIASSGLTQFIADAHDIPLATGSVDGVWIQAVLEHVLDPWRVAEEIHRVLAPQGIVYADTPFMQPVHAGPWDFTRFSESGHRWLFRRFERIDSGVVSGSGSTLVTSIDYAVRAIFRSSVLGRVFRRVLWPLATAIDRVGGRAQMVDAASAVFFLGRRAERSLVPRDMIAEYRGAQRGSVHDSR